MSDWIMLTLVGKDQPGIVARVTQALFEGGWTLGEASMIRLGGNFTIMMMVSGDGQEALQGLIKPVCDDKRLHSHLVSVGGALHQHMLPNYQVRVMGADRAGIVAQVTGALAEAGFNILELESDVAGSASKPVYIMNIQGYSDHTLEDLQAAVDALNLKGIEVSVSAVDMLIG